MNKYLDKLIFLAQTNKLPHAIIIESNDMKGACETVRKVILNSLCTSQVKPCGKCSNCVKNLKNSHPDVKFINSDNASVIKIDSIRKIRSDAYISSNEGGQKFYIIVHGEVMTVQAQNAFIKILEEPPKDVIFMILCTSCDAVLPTIKSRCQVFKDVFFDVSEGESERYSNELAEFIFLGNKADILKLIGKFSDDRTTVRNVLEKTVSKLIRKHVASGNFDGTKNSKVDQIEKLRYILDLVDKNVNCNLLLYCMCAMI